MGRDFEFVARRPEAACRFSQRAESLRPIHLSSIQMTRAFARFDPPADGSGDVQSGTQQVLSYVPIALRYGARHAATPIESVWKMTEEFYFTFSAIRLAIASRGLKVAFTVWYTSVVVV